MLQLLYKIYIALRTLMLKSNSIESVSVCMDYNKQNKNSMVFLVYLYLSSK